MSRRKIALIAAPLLALTMLAAACGDSDSASDSGSGSGGSDNCPGTVGCTPAFPGGDITIGILSPGDTNDDGYYESFVVAAEEYAEEKGWKTIIIDRVEAADAATQARSLCEQGANFIGLADGDMYDAVEAAQDDVCEGVVFYINSDEELNGYVFNTEDDVYESQLTAGYATGLVMKELGKTKAAFIGGPDLDFVTQAFDSWTAGIKQVIPNATTTKTLTGDFDDSALGQEAAKSQISAGAELLYPYMGGATNAVAKAGLDAGIYSVAPGTDRCADPAFAVSSLFPPGEFLLQAIKAWENEEIKMGESFFNKVGVQEFPSSIVCDNGNVPNAEKLQAEVDAFMKKIGNEEINAEEVVKGTK